MRTLHLEIREGELLRVEYRNEQSGKTCVSIRGKAGDQTLGFGSFQWTAAVRALCVLILRTLEEPDQGFLSGEGGSLAASLDYALTKKPLWLLEMFGVTGKGETVARRLVLRSNSERKRPGPVSLWINRNFLSLANLRVFSDGRQIVDRADLSALRERLEGRPSEEQGFAPKLAA